MNKSCSQKRVQNKAKEGLKKVYVWVPIEHKKSVKLFAEVLRKCEN